MIKYYKLYNTMNLSQRLDNLGIDNDMFIDTIFVGTNASIIVTEKTQSTLYILTTKEKKFQNCFVHNDDKNRYLVKKLNQISKRNNPLSILNYIESVNKQCSSFELGFKEEWFMWNQGNKDSISLDYYLLIKILMSSRKRNY